MQARIYYKKADGSLDTINREEKDYELHDGYVKIRDTDRPDSQEWTVLPMHRIVTVEEFH